jgi:hypothetical protein
MSAATAYRHHESSQPVTITDKRGQLLKGSPRQGEALPIGELGSKAIYQVSAQRFTAVTPDQ